MKNMGDVVSKEYRDIRQQDIEIRTTKDGRIFGIKNIRQEFDGNKMIMKADVAGDIKAGQEYLEYLTKRLKESVSQ